MTPPVVINDLNRARQGLRDATGNLDVSPPRGENGAVSQRGMTETAYATRGLSGGPRQQSGLSSDLAASVNAATVPQPGPGQAHNSAGTGAREGTQNNGQSRGTGLGPQGK